MKTIEEIKSKIRYYEQSISENNELKSIAIGEMRKENASDETIKEGWAYLELFNRQNAESANSIYLLKWVADIIDD